MPSQALTYNAD